jgi:hypothetical protein
MPFTNKNQCRNFGATTTTGGWVELAANGVDKGSGGIGMVCSEVLITYAGTGGVLIRDRWDGSTAANCIYVPKDVPTIIHGVTNTNDLSAQAVANGGTLYYRSQYYTGIVLTG